MKKIAVYIKDNDNAKKAIKNFCEEESFSFIDVDNPKSLNDADHSWIMLIVDRLEEKLFSKKFFVPVVLVGDHVKFDNINTCYHLSHNFNNICLRGLVDTIYHGGILDTFTNATKPSYIKKRYKIFNDIFNVDKIVYSLTRELVYFFKISDVQKLRIGISEMLTNAIEHGNLEINGDKKFVETEKGTYMEFLKQRLKDDKYKDRYVDLMVEINDELFKTVIKDMGSGFNTKSVSNQFDDENLLKLHGRGILITKMYFDEVSYNNKGNEVTLVKRISEC